MSLPREFAADRRPHLCPWIWNLSPNPQPCDHRFAGGSDKLFTARIAKIILASLYTLEALSLVTRLRPRAGLARGVRAMLDGAHT